MTSGLGNGIVVVLGHKFLVIETVHLQQVDTLGAIMCGDVENGMLDGFIQIVSNDADYLALGITVPDQAEQFGVSLTEVLSGSALTCSRVTAASATAKIGFNCSAVGGKALLVVGPPG